VLLFILLLLLLLLLLLPLQPFLTAACPPATQDGACGALQTEVLGAGLADDWINARCRL
jgi:hypothetical protein